MAKKLVTRDNNLVTKVENVLKDKKVPCARVQLKNTDEFMLAVLNRHGGTMKEVIDTFNPDSKYYFGVLRNHPEYTVPRGILKELADEEQKN